MITFLSSLVKQLAGEQAAPAGPQGQGGEAGNTGGKQAFSRTFASVLGGNVPQNGGETAPVASGESASGEKAAMSLLAASAPGMGRVAQLSGQGKSVPADMANGSAAGPEEREAAETVSEESARTLQGENTGGTEGEKVASREGGKVPESAEKGNSKSGKPDASGTGGDAQTAKAADPAAALNAGKPDNAKVAPDGGDETAVKKGSGSSPAAQAEGSGKDGNSRPAGGKTPQPAASGEKAVPSAGSQEEASSGKSGGASKAAAATAGQSEGGQKRGQTNGSQTGGGSSPVMNGDTGKNLKNGRGVTTVATSASGQGVSRAMPADNNAGRPSHASTISTASTPGNSENGTVTQNGSTGKAGGSDQKIHSTGAGSGGGRGVTPGGTSVSGQGASQAMPAENIAGRPSPAKTISTVSNPGSSENGRATQNGSSGGETRGGQSTGDAKGNSGSGRSASSGREAGTAAGKGTRPSRSAPSAGKSAGSSAMSTPQAKSAGAAGEAGETMPKLSSPLLSGQAPDSAARAENTQGAVFQPMNRVTEPEKEFIPTLKSTEGEFKISSREMMDAEMSGGREFDGSEEGDKGEMKKLETLNSSQLQSSSARRKLGLHIGRMVRQEMAQSQEGSDAQWRHHRFVLDDGKSVNVSFRQADGAIQVQLGTGNAELNRLLQQNMDEIRQHLRQELDVEVDLEFQNFEEGELREGHSERPGRGGGGSLSAGTAEGKQADVPPGGNRQTVRYLGFNTNEWTA